MKRKVIKLAEKTLVISLPHKWVKEWNITKGDELNADMKGASILFSTETDRKKQKITINTEKSSERVIRWWLSCLHKKGFDEIEIFYKKEQLPLFSELIKDLFTGFAIIEQTDKRCVLQAVAQDNQATFDNILRRSFLVTLSLGDSIIEMIKKNKYEELKELLQLEKTNNQLTNFCQRIINKKGMPEPATNSFYYTIAWNLEKVADDYKNIIKNIIKQDIKISQETINLLENANKLVRGFYEFFYEQNQEKINNLHELKKKMQRQIETEVLKQNKENVVLSRILGLIDKTLDFTVSMIAIHTD